MRSVCVALAVLAAALAAAQEAPLPGEEFVRGMTVSFPGDQALSFRIRSQPLPDEGQGGAVAELQLGPPLDLWVLGPDENRLPVEGARLTDPVGQIVPPREPGHWRIDRPPLGYLTLEVPALGSPWRLWSAFHPFMVRLDESVRVLVGESPGAVFLHPSGQRLDLPTPGPAAITPAEGARWVAFAPWDLFEPSQPRVEIEGATTIAPGERLRLRAVTEDPDDDVARITWHLPDDRTVGGAELDLPVSDFAAFAVGVTVEDRAGAGASAQVMVAPPQPHEVELPGMILVQAEDFAAQGGGEVEVTDRGHNVGQMITKWHQDAGHWLEWRFTVPQSGRYAIYARYGTSGAETRRALSIDGVSPGACFDGIAFASTGGYGQTAEQWRVLRLGPAVELAAGEHALRMTNLGDGLALDYLALVPVEGE